MVLYWCRRCFFAIVAIVVVPGAVAVSSSNKLQFDLWKIDWQAIGAIAAGLAAAAAAYAAFLAIRIDDRAAARMKDRELRDAMPLAFAIQREVHHVSGMADTIIQAKENFPGTPAYIILGSFAGAADQFRAPILSSNLNRLGCFDFNAGKAMGLAAASISALNEALNVPALDEEDEDFTNKVLDGLIKSASFAKKYAHIADTLLMPYIKAQR